jgi:hypothetical protein
MKHLPILFYLGRGKRQVLTLVGLQISTCQSPKEAGVALDVIGRRLVRLFHPTNTGGFLLQHLESGKCNTSCLSITPTL